MDNETLVKAQRVLKAIDDAIAAGSWNETNFIVVLGKKLRMMREELVLQIQKSQEEAETSPAYLAYQAQIRANLKRVYVSLYSVEGSSLSSWERIVFNLKRQMVSRPVYEKEEYIQDVIKTKEKKINEAYVCIYVNEEDILPISQDKLALDKLGKPMLVLKDNAINLENLDYFVHATGIYQYLRGRLVKIE